MKIAITGGPKTGKTTLSGSHSGVVRHTDDTIPLGWSEGSEEVARWFGQPFDVIEGVSVPRALRKFMQANEKAKPCDKLIVLTKAHVPLVKGQESMAKGVQTVLGEILPELRKRGVEIEIH